MVYHIPALLDESIEGLNVRPDGVYVDALSVAEAIQRRY